MLGTGYFLKNQSVLIAKISSRKRQKKCQSAKINSRKNFVPHGRPGIGVAYRFQAPGTNQPRSQSSSAISDVTSPVKLVRKIRLGLSRSVPSLLL